MDIFALIAQIFASQDVIIRFSLIILLALYGLFALIIAIQIGNLNRVVKQIGFSGVLNFLATIHFLAAIALLLISVLSL